MSLDAASLEKPETPTTLSVGPEMSYNEHSEKAGEVVTTAPDHVFEPEYVAGKKLVLVVGSAALACFLMLVDTMVISTVSIFTNTFRNEHCRLTLVSG